MQVTDVVIIGAGPAGLFTIFQVGMLGMKCHVIDAFETIGGQCSALYPQKPIFDIAGYPKILAQDLIEQLAIQAKPFNPTYNLNQQVTHLKADNDCFMIRTSKNLELQSKAVIIAGGHGGFGPNKLPIAGIEKFENKSIFYSIKDPNEFTGKNLLIAGGGDSAVDWAINLAKITNNLYLVHRRDKFRAAPESLRQLKELEMSGKINVITGYQLDGINGDDGYLKQVFLKDFNDNIKILDVDILCPFFGLAQSLGPIADWGLGLNCNNIKVTQPHYMTNIDGIYAIGDIATYEGKLKLILTGFAEAAHATHHAYNRVFPGKQLHFEYSTTKGVRV